MTDIAVRTVSNDVAPNTAAKASGSARAACERRAFTCTAFTVLMSTGVGARVNVDVVKSLVPRTTSPPAALLELCLSLTPLPPWAFLSSEGSGLAAARSRAALRTELAEGLAAVRACAPARAAASTAWPSSWRTLIMLLMSKESEAAASRTRRKTVARTRAAPDSDVRCRLPDDLCVRSVLIGMPVPSWRPSSPGAGVVVAAARAAVLGPLAEDGEVAVRRRHHRAAAHRPIDELAPRAAADVRGAARRPLRMRDDGGLPRLREGAGEIELVGDGGHGVDVGRVVRPGPAGSR